MGRLLACLLVLALCRPGSARADEAETDPPPADDAETDAAVALLLEAIDLLRYERWADAAAKLDRALAIDDSVRAAYFHRALCRLELGDPNAAGRDLDRYELGGTTEEERERARELRARILAAGGPPARLPSDPLPEPEVVEPEAVELPEVVEGPALPPEPPFLIAGGSLLGVGVALTKTGLDRANEAGDLFRADHAPALAAHRAGIALTVAGSALLAITVPVSIAYRRGSVTAFAAPGPAGGALGVIVRW